MFAVHMGMWGSQQATVVKGCLSPIAPAKIHGQDSLEDGATKGR